MCPQHTTSQDILLKRCAKCGELKPATAEYFARDRKKQDGLFAGCKACYLAIRTANKESLNAKGRAYYAANKEREAERKRIYHAANKERRTEYTRKYRAENRARVAEHARAYRARTKEREAEYRRAYYLAHKEHKAAYARAYAEANRERVAEQKRVWRVANRERMLALVRQYRARKRNAEGTHTVQDVREQYARQKGKCYWCGEKVGEGYHVDHIVPLSRGGANSPDNLVISCPSCNHSKNNKLPHEWARGGRLL